MNRRSFTRLFRRETGMSFAQWRQQACLAVALPRLAAGEPATTTARGLGYDSTTAFLRDVRVCDRNRTKSARSADRC